MYLVRGSGDSKTEVYYLDLVSGASQFVFLQAFQLAGSEQIRGVQVSPDFRFLVFSSTQDTYIYYNVNQTNTERIVYNVTTTVVEGNSTPFQYTKEIAAIS